MTLICSPGSVCASTFARDLLCLSLYCMIQFYSVRDKEVPHKTQRKALLSFSWGGGGTDTLSRETYLSKLVLPTF